MEEKQRNKVGYYSVIPSKILYNKELKANEKLLYAMITSLAYKEGYCFATNNYFAEELGVHPKTVSSWISDLRDKNYIKVEMVRKENKQIIQRKIYINDVPYPLNNGYQYQSKNGQAIHQNMEDNNIRFNNKNNNSNTTISEAENTNQTKNVQTEDKSFTLTALGDILCHNTQYWDAHNTSTDEYDFSYVFEDIKKYTENSDITIANLETSFAGKERGYSNYPTFNSPDSLATALKDIGIDIITTAGNHCLDMGFSGLSKTIDVLGKNNIEHLGTYKTEEEQNKTFIKEINGLKVAFIDYTYGTNGIPVPEGKKYCVNLIDKDLIKKHIKMAKDENADIIIASMHWGTEYRTTANEEQKELSNFLFQNGVDIIIGNHPHVIEPFETREVTMPDGTTKQCFVAYALGNFTADQNAINTRDSIILNMKITKKVDGTICIDNINYVPIYMYKNTSVSTHKFKLIDLNSEIETYENGTNKSISNTTYNLFKKELSTIEEESSVIAEFTPKSENDYTIKCKIVENNETIFEVKTFAGSRERAKRIVDNWKQNASEIYPKILNLLLDDKKE